MMNKIVPKMQTVATRVVKRKAILKIVVIPSPVHPTSKKLARKREKK
jgi:hypothetical protein